MNPVFAPTRVDYLENGLRVLTREVHHAPVACTMVWYRVGSRNEVPGITGLSHFLEHMMFKGTPRFPRGVLEEGVKRRGGTRNAFTSYDYTAYFELLPSQHLEFGLAVEADRMVNMTFDEALTLNERGVIVSEREGYENSPQTWLREQFLAAAFTDLPYGHAILGTKEDIKATTAAALTRHYRHYYRPNNATVVVVGDFESDRLVELVRKHYGHLPRGADVEPLRLEPQEPTQERRCEVRRPGPNPYMMAGYRVPAASHADMPVLSVLGAVLSGASAMSAGGGGMGRSSRFQRLLVNKGIAANASASTWGLEHAGLFMCGATPVPGVAPERLEAAVFEQIEGLRQDPIPADELARAKKQVRAQLMYGMETTSNQAYMLGGTAMSQSVERFDRAAEYIEAVSAEDLLRAARTYLDPNRRTVGWFLPDEGKAGASDVAKYQPPEPERVETPEYQKPGHLDQTELTTERPPSMLDQERIVRRQLPQGATLLVYPAETVPSVFVRVQLEAGATHDPAGRTGLAQLTAQLLTRGSEAFTAEELAIRTDSMGIAIRADSGRETAVVTLKCLPEDLEQGISLLAEVIRRPTFPAAEFSRMRERTLVAVREANNDTRSVAARGLAEALYPETHPLRHPLGGTEESLQALAPEDLNDFHGRHYGPADAVITVVGHVDPTRAEQALAAALTGWTGGAGRRAMPPVERFAPVRKHLVLAGKTQTDIALGWPLVDRSHPDYLALEVLAILFGGNGMMSSNRMRAHIREAHGLSYYQYAAFQGSTGPSAWTAHLGVNPARVEFTVDLLRKELQRLSEEVVAEAELDELKGFVENFTVVQHEAPERVAARLAELERHGLGLDYVQRYPALVRALTPASLQDAAARYLDVERWAVVTAGPHAE